MDKFTIITNTVKDKNLAVTGRIERYLKSHHRECLVLVADQESEREGFCYTDESAVPDDMECIIVLGGDGTLLSAARDVVNKQIPLLGINMGTLGYLAEIDRHSIYPALDCLMDNRFTVESRMMLRGCLYREGKIIADDIALNDIVISREGRMHVIRFNNYINDTYLNMYKADGIIISTPTGSTGYSLSAGGPIISPEASLILMTPIAPHTLNTRSIVFAPTDQITVELGEGRDGARAKGTAYFDGIPKAAMETGDRILIGRSDKSTRIIKINHISFLETLRNKMGDH